MSLAGLINIERNRISNSGRGGVVGGGSGERVNPARPNATVTT